MKLIIAILALTAVVGCASKSKNATTPTTTTTTTAEAKAKTETKAAETKPAVATKAAPAAKKTEIGTTGITCKAGADERSLAINVKDAGCELVYTKQGEAKTIATQIKGSEKCEEVMTQVKENLTKANFACQ